MTPAPTSAPANRPERASADDQACVCGHPRSRHEYDASDTRCIAVKPRGELLDTFDDGRASDPAYCGCLRFRSASAPQGERVFARIASTPLPRPGDAVAFEDGTTGVVETAKVADDLRDAKCVVILDVAEGGTAS